MSRQKSRDQFPENWKIVISPNAKPMTSDDICRCLTGMDVKRLAEAIKENKDGRYDDLLAAAQEPA